MSLGRAGYFQVFSRVVGAAWDWDAPLLRRRFNPFPDGRCPGGLGSGPLGTGSLGHGYWGVGLGAGMCGRGPLGRGTRTLKATGPAMADGDYDIAVVGYDELGNADTVGDRVEAEITLAGVPQPPGEPVASWVASAATMTFELSPDDEG